MVAESEDKPNKTYFLVGKRKAFHIRNIRLGGRYLGTLTPL